MVIELNTPPDIPAICRFVGLIGVALYVVAYFCLCLGKLDAAGRFIPASSLLPHPACRSASGRIST